MYVNVGFVITYHAAKMRWYHEQLKPKDGEQTVTLHLTKEKFYNGTREYEWKIDGESYDMRSYTETDSGVTVIAVHDPYEHQLTNILTAGFRHQDEKQTSPLTRWVQVFSNPALVESQLYIEPNWLQAFVEFYPVNYLSRMYSRDVPRPPLF